MGSAALLAAALVLAGPLGAGEPARNFLAQDACTTTVLADCHSVTYDEPHAAEGEAPVEIRTRADLDAIRADLDGHYILMNDIDLSGAPFEPIGTAVAPFEGVFDGNDRVISGFHFDGLATSRFDTGLFGVARGARLFDLHLVDVNVSGFVRVGGLVGMLDGGSRITGCTVMGEVTGLFDETGGMAGMTTVSKVEDCAVDVRVYDALGGSFRTGALIGHAHIGSLIANCTAIGEVTAHDTTGGMFGALHGSVAIGCTASVTVIGDGWAGGLAGYVKKEDGWLTEIRDCAALKPGSVESRGLGNRAQHAQGTGGLVGYLERECAVYDSFANVDVHGYVPDGVGQTTNAGGLIGFMEPESRVYRCRAEGDVTGYDCGGLVGWITGDVYDSHASGDVAGVGFCGGFSGNIEKGGGRFGGLMVGCSASGDVYAGPTANGHSDPVDHPFASAGGLVGYAFPGGRIYDCWASGDVVGEGQYVGGLVGFFWDCKVRRCAALGNVTGYGKKVGGLIGGVQEVRPSAGVDVVIEDSFALGDVMIVNEDRAFIGDAGGLIGSVVTDHAGRTLIRRCYAAGRVMVDRETAGGLVGRFVGCNGTGTIVQECVWDMAATGKLESAPICQGRPGPIDHEGSDPLPLPLDDLENYETIREVGFARTPSEMADPQMYEFLRWDLDEVWMLEPGDAYPLLRNLPEELVEEIRATRWSGRGGEGARVFGRELAPFDSRAPAPEADLRGKGGR